MKYLLSSILLMISAVTAQADAGKTWYILWQGHDCVPASKSMGAALGASSPAQLEELIRRAGMTPITKAMRGDNDTLLAVSVTASDAPDTALVFFPSAKLCQIGKQFFDHEMGSKEELK